MVATPFSDDMYMRYISFADEKSMRKTVMERSPHKIDIGAVYTASVGRRRLFPWYRAPHHTPHSSVLLGVAHSLNATTP